MSMTPSNVAQILLCAQTPALAAAWQAAFRDVQPVVIHRGSILDIACDAVVSPANSFGFMDGGIDAVYLDRFGPELQDRLRRIILRRHHGELVVGTAEAVETGDVSVPWLIAAPTMRVPMALPRDTINAYLATRAALLCAAGRLGQGVRRLAFPGMGTGVGQIPAEICARQMRSAYDSVHAKPACLPKSWADASWDHQLLYTQRPQRLQ